MNIAAEIRAEMARRGISTKSLADSVGLRRPYLSLRLNEHREFLSGELNAIGDALGVPAWELMRRAEENASALAAAASSSSSGAVA